VCPSQLINRYTEYTGTEMASSTDSSTTVDEEVRRLYERYQSAENDEERREIALEMGKLDGRRHADIYAALENE
jgi:hypothetical protein